MSQYTLGPAPTSTLRTIPFTIPVSSWVLDNGVYTATFASAYITESSKEMCTFDESFRNYAKRDINVSKTSGGGSITLTTSVIPTGAVSGTIFTIDADDGKVCMVIEDTVLPISNGGTGANTLAGAKQNLGITELSNQKMDLIWDSGYDLDAFGQEYLGAFYTKIINGQSYKILFSGDSTFAMQKGTSAGVDYIFEYYIRSFGKLKGTYVNTAVSGATASDWVANTLATDIAHAPTLYFIRYGFNNESGDTDEERANNYYNVMRGALTTIRNALPVDQCSIVLLMPNSSNDDARNRGYSMKKALEPKVRKLAREFGCGFIDLFRTWYDAGPYASEMYDNPYGDGTHIHPSAQQNRNISSKLVDFVLPTTMRGTSVISRLATASPLSPNTGAMIPFPDGLNQYNTGVLNCFLGVGTTMYGPDSARWGYMDSNGIYVSNIGGAAGYVYVDVFFQP